jgi:hypothetical protein
MKGVELAVSRRDRCRNVAIAQVDHWSIRANAWFRQLMETVWSSDLFGTESNALMFGRSLIAVLVILACLIGLAAPVLVDARHWWPRTAKRERPRLGSNCPPIELLQRGQGAVVFLNSLTTAPPRRR